MDVLRNIMNERAQDVARLRRTRTEDRLREESSGRKHRSLAERLRSRRGAAIVAEVKKASPSAGLLRPRYEPARIAVQYAEAGAVGVSVLTEPRHFLGSEGHLRQVRAAVDLPVLRKDFLCDPWQVLESAAWGADVVLLIVAALDRRTLRTLYGAAVRAGLEVLAEAHTGEDLDRALELDEAVIGVNSRDLKTLRTDLKVAEKLARRIPDDRLCIAESGIRTRADIVRFEAAGYDGFLIGETFLKAARPGEKLKELRGVAG